MKLAYWQNAAFAALKNYEPLVDCRNDRVTAINGSERRFAFSTSSGLAGRTRPDAIATRR